MIRFMKKNILLLFIIFLNVAVYSKSNDLIPDWILNFNKEFPDTVYFAQKGTGKKKDLAKLEAMANLSYYFETSVVANRESNFKKLIVHHYEDQEYIIDPSSPNYVFPIHPLDVDLGGL